MDFLPLDVFSSYFATFGIRQLVFWLLTILGLGGAVGMIMSRHPVYSVLSLILNFFAIGGFYLTLHAEFLAVIQIIVYAGAILVLFLFVIMLLNLDETTTVAGDVDLQKVIGFVLGFALMGELIVAMTGLTKLPPPATPDFFAYGKAEPVGHQLMTDYVFPFEMISLILLAALMGALVIAKRRKAE
jgi:NADH-quinone oxidoreductase subunit J